MNTVPVVPNTPPVPAGFNGNLSPYQKSQLKKMWVRILEACEFHQDVSNRVRMVGGPSAVPKPPIEFSHSSLTKAPDLVFGDQEAISENFKERHYTPPQALTNVYGGPLLREAFWQGIAGDFADDIFLRFLRARDFDVEATLSYALQVLSAWYDLDVAGILKRGEGNYLPLFHRGPAYVQGYTTVRGGSVMPVFIVNPARMLAGGQSTEALQAFIVLITQSLHQLMVSQYGRAIFIVDLHGFNETSLDWQTVLFSIKYLQLIMTGRMEVTFLHRMPWAFRGVWHTILPMLDPVVRAKIRFSHSPQDLEQYVPLDLLPIHLGGTAQWQWRYFDPKPDEEIVMNNIDIGEMIELELQELMKTLDQVSVEWASIPTGDPREANLDFRRSVLQVQVRLKQLQLRPFIYATNVYNRSGILNESGSVTWNTMSTESSGPPEVLTLFQEYSIPALIEWLESHGQDTMKDSFGGQYGACGTNRSPELIPLYVREKYSPVASSVGSGSAASNLSSPVVSTSNTTAAQEAADGLGNSAMGLASSSPGRPCVSSVTRDWTSLGVPGSQRPSPQLPNSNRRSLSSQLPEKSSVTSSLQQVPSASGGSVPEEKTPHSDPQSSSLETPLQPTSSVMPSPEHSGSSSESEHSFNWVPTSKITPSYIPTRTLTKTDVALSDAELLRDCQRARVARDLFLSGQISDIGDMVTKYADVRPCSAAAMAIVNALRAFLSFDSDDLVVAMNCCVHAINIVELLRKKRSKIGRVLSFSGANATYATMSTVQLHAEMLAAELRILLAILTSIQTKSKTTMARVVLTLKTARKIILGLTEYIQAVDDECERASVEGKKPSRVLDEDFRSGVLMARSVFLFVANAVPQGVSSVLGLPQNRSDAARALKYALAPGGWSRTRFTPLVSATEEGIQRPMADLTALIIQLVISQFYPTPNVDLELCDAIVAFNLKRFPDSPMFLHAQARLFLNQALPERAIELLQEAIRAWKSTQVPANAIHMCLWDLATCYIIIGDWQAAYDCYDNLSKNSNWTKSMFQYLKGAVLYELDPSQADRVTTIMRTVPMLSRSGIGPESMEGYEVLRAEKFFTPGRKTTLLIWEHMYVFHMHRYMPVFVIVQDYLPRLENTLAYLTSLSSPEQHGGQRDYYAGLCTTRLLKGTALSYICYPAEGTIARLPPNSKMGTREEMAEEGCRTLEASFECAPYLEGQDRILIYFSHLELARLHFRMGKIALAKKECQQLLSTKDLAPGASTGFWAHGRPHAPMSHMYLVRTQQLLDDIMSAPTRRQKTS